MKKHSHIENFERTVLVLKAVQQLPVASTSELSKVALPKLTIRSTQRYLKGLEKAGYIRRHADGFNEARFFLTEKAKQLFGICNDNEISNLSAGNCTVSINDFR